MVSLVCKSILLWAKRLPQAKTRMQTMRRDKRFIVVLFCPRTGWIASEIVVAQASCLGANGRLAGSHSCSASGKMPNGPTGKMPVLR